LEFFILTDRRRSIAETSSSPITRVDPNKKVRIQIDILTGLFPMLLEPKVSFYAQETLLTAINTGDTRIISFLAENTNFPETLVKNICDSYRETVSYLLSFPQQQCYELIYSSSNSYLSLFFAKSSSTGGMSGGIASNTNNSTPMMNRTGSLGAMPFTPSGGKQQTTSNNFPITPSGGANKGGFHNNFPPPAIPTVTNAKQQPGQPLHHQHLHPLEKFIKSLVFIKAIYSTLKNQLTLLEIKQLQYEMHHSGHHFPKRTTNNSAPWDNSESLEFMKKLKHLVKKISFFYLDEFLNELLIPALESTTNEFANIVNYYLLRLLLLSLGDSNSENNNIPDNSFDILSCHRRKHKSEVKRLFSLSMSLDSEKNDLAEISTPLTVKSEGLLDEFVQLQPLLSLTLKKLFLNPEQEDHHHRHEEEEEGEETKPENEISPTNDNSEEDQNKKLSSSSAEKNQKSKKRQNNKKKNKKNQTYVRYNSIWISLFDRTTSMSKVLSTVSMQCIETILSIAPPLFMLETLSLPPLRMKQTEYESILTTMKSNASQISLLAANHPSNNPNSTSSTSGTTTATTSSSSSMFSTPSSAATASQSSITEVWNIRKIEDYQMNFTDTLKKYLNYYSTNQNNNIAVSGNEFKRDDLKNSFYISLTIQQLLKKLYHQGDSWNIVMFSAIIGNSTPSLTYLDADKLLDPMDTLLYPAATLVNEQSNEEFDHSSPSSPTNNSTYYLYNDFIIEKYYRRLSNNYYTMKLDEQISFSKLIYDFFIYCSFFIIINPNELINKQSLQLLLQFLNKINYLLNEMETKYLKNITDIQKKLAYFKLYLSEEAKDYLVMSREREFEEKLKVLSNNPVNPSQTSSVASSGKSGGPPQQQQLPQTPQAVQEKPQPSPATPAPVMVTPMKSQPPSQSQSASSAQQQQQTPASASKTSSFLFKRTLSSFLNRAGDSSLDTNSSHHKDTNSAPATNNPSNPSPVGGSPMNSTHNNPSTHSDKGDSGGPSKTKLKKFIENETLQVQSMITGYLILQEISMELYSFLYAIDSLKQLFQQNFMNVQAHSSSSPASSPWKVSNGKNGGGDLGSPFVIGGLSSNSFEMELSATTKVTAEKQPRGEEREGGEFFINDYEEDEKELEEMKQLLNSFDSLNMNNNNNNNSKSNTNADETEFLMEFNSLQLSLDQMISAVY
jgi:hypothetical protein